VNKKKKKKNKMRPAGRREEEGLQFVNEKGRRREEKAQLFGGRGREIARKSGGEKRGKAILENPESTSFIRTSKRFAAI